MDKVVNEVFNIGKSIIQLIDKVIYYFRVQNLYTALQGSKELLDNMIQYIEKIMSIIDYLNDEVQLVNIDLINQMLLELLQAQEDKDWILLTDLFEIKLLGLMISIQEKIICKEKFIIDEKRLNKNIAIINEKDIYLGEILKDSMDVIDILNNGYFIEYTATGDFTIAINNNETKRYFHTNNRVMNEALALANSWYKEDKNEYIIYGLGLGYHIMSLFELDDNIFVKVYESDINIIKLACMFSDIDGLVENPNFKLIYDPDYNKLKKQLILMGESTEFVIHYPSLYNVKNNAIKEMLEDYFVQYSSIKNQLKFLNGNFIENIKYGHPSVQVLEDKFKDKDLYIVAAGPSLDKNFMHLKNISEKGIILSTGTVFRKLLASGITPDYVIVTDAFPHLYKLQIEGLEESDVPLIYLSTTCKSVIKNYKGKKYIVFQKEYDLSEDIAEKNSYMLFNTGGSVSTTALDIGINLQCKRIIFLGLDLSFPCNLSHASDTSLRNTIEMSDLRQVLDISGNKLYTSKVMDMYRKWIERRIKGISTPEIIDATEGGVYIEGMRYARLEDVINSNTSI